MRGTVGAALTVDDEEASQRDGFEGEEQDEPVAVARRVAGASGVVGAAAGRGDRDGSDRRSGAGGFPAPSVPVPVDTWIAGIVVEFAAPYAMRMYTGHAPVSGASSLRISKYGSVLIDGSVCAPHDVTTPVSFWRVRPTASSAADTPLAHATKPALLAECGVIVNVVLLMGLTTRSRRRHPGRQSFPPNPRNR